MKLREMVSFFMFFVIVLSVVLQRDVKTEQEGQCQEKEIAFKIND